VGGAKLMPLTRPRWLGLPPARPRAGVLHVALHVDESGGIASVLRAYRAIAATAAPTATATATAAPTGRAAATGTGLADGLADSRFLVTYRSGGDGDGARSPFPRRLATLLRLAAPLEPRALARVRWTARGHERVHVHLSHRFSLVRDGMAARAARRAGCEVFVTVHGSSIERDCATRARLVAWALRPARAVAVLNCQVEAALAAVVGPERLFRLPNPAPPPGLAAAARVPGPAAGPETGGRAAGRARFLFVGELSRRKGIDVLLDAWPRVARETGGVLTLLGAPLDSELTRRAAGLAGVELAGRQAPAAVAGYLSRATVFVLPSRSEGMPMALLEAMSAGLAVVASDIPSIRAAADGAALLAPVGDATGLADALVAAATDPGARAALAGRARARAADLSGGAAARRLAEFYRHPPANPPAANPMEQVANRC